MTKKYRKRIKVFTILAAISIVLFGPLSGFLFIRDRSLINWQKNMMAESISEIVRTEAPFYSGTDDWHSYNTWGFDNKTLKPIALKGKLTKTKTFHFDWLRNNLTNPKNKFDETYKLTIGSYKLGKLFTAIAKPDFKLSGSVNKYSVKDWYLSQNYIDDIWLYSNFAKKAFLAKPIDIITQAKPDWIKQGATSDNIVVNKDFSSHTTWNSLYDNQGQIKITLSFKNSKTKFSSKEITFVANFNYKPKKEPFIIEPTDGPQYSIKNWQ